MLLCMAIQTLSNSEIFTYEVEKLEPTVAAILAWHISAARELQETELNKAYIGSFNGAKPEDLRCS